MLGWLLPSLLCLTPFSSLVAGMSRHAAAVGIRVPFRYFADLALGVGLCRWPYGLVTLVLSCLLPCIVEDPFCHHVYATCIRSASALYSRLSGNTGQYSAQ